MRQTSIDCYNQIKSEGLLSKMRMKVYETLLNSAPCTSAEAFKSMLTKENQITQSRARFTELRELGVIYEKGIKKCTVTGRKVIEWDLTDKLPLKVIRNDNKHPKNLKKCVDYIIKKMDYDGKIFIHKDYLLELKKV